MYENRYGRFTAVDPLLASGKLVNSQSFNRYSYLLNSPYKFTDPLGLLALTSVGACAQRCQRTGSQVDGSAFRGREYFGEVVEYGLNLFTLNAFHKYPTQLIY